jgi:Calcium binding
MEILVDAYTPEEQAMEWYYSLEDRLGFPFVARCTAERTISPLRVGDEVEVVGMAPEAECQHGRGRRFNSSRAHHACSEQGFCRLGRHTGGRDLWARTAQRSGQHLSQGRSNGVMPILRSRCSGA